MSRLPVSEAFQTVQGEGPHVGEPAIFLRLAGCNLKCGFKGRDIDDVDPSQDEPVEGATWICDTADVWKEPEHTYSPEELFNEFSSNGWLEDLDEGAHLVLTGGEPTLPSHQEAFSEFMELFIDSGRDLPFVEVETNGTLIPNSLFNEYVDAYNVSLKLSNSGHTDEERIKGSVVAFHRDNPDSVFKFVVSSEQDVDEIERIRHDYNIPKSKVMLMPAGLNQDQLSETYPSVVELCKERNYRFSQRLHVELWDEMTGV